MSEPQIYKITTGTMLRAVAVLAGVWFIVVIRDTIGIILVSLLLAALLNPIANYFEKFKIPRSVSILVVYLILFVFFGVLLLAVIPPMINEARDIALNFGQYWQKIVLSFESLKVISAQYGLSDNLQKSITSIENAFSGSFVNLFSTVTGIIGNVRNFFIILVIAFFLVVDKQSVRKIFYDILPKRYFEYIASLIPKMQNKVGQWLLGEIILMVFVGVLTYLGLILFGVPYALLLAVLAGVGEIIPYIGFTMAFIPAVFLAGSDSLSKVFIVCIIYFVIQRVEHMVLVPKVMQKTTGINPILAILALTVGWAIGGIAGVLLAIPVATAGNVVLTDYIEKQNRLNS